MAKYIELEALERSFEEQYLEYRSRRQRVLFAGRILGDSTLTTAAIVMKSCLDSLREAPAADVAPVRHGRWAYCDTYMDGITMFTCSCCGDKQNGRNGWSWKKNFCPNCGAKMDLEDNHDSD